MAPSIRTMRADDLCSSSRDFPVDATFELIDMFGFDPAALTVANIDYLRQQLSGNTVGLVSTGASLEDLIASVFPEKPIVKITMPKKGRNLYTLAPDGETKQVLRDGERQVISMEEFLAMLEDSVEFPDADGRVSPGSQKPKGAAGSTSSAKRGEPKTKFTDEIHIGLVYYLLDRSDELRLLLRGGSRSSPKHVHHDDAFLKKLLGADMFEAIEDNGMKVEALDVLDFMKTAVIRKNRRDMKEVRTYVKTEPDFLKKFPSDTYLSSKDGVLEAVAWIAKNKDHSHRDTVFYSRAIKATYGNRDDYRKSLKELVTVANHYDFGLNCPIMSSFEKSATPEEHMTHLVKQARLGRFSYHNNDAVRIFHYLWVKGQVQSRISKYYNARRYQPAVANYLIVNFDKIKKVIDGVFDRVKQSEYAQDTSVQDIQTLTSFVEERFDNSTESIKMLKLAINRQFSPEDVAKFDNMKIKGQLIDACYRVPIINMYLKAEAIK